MRRTLLGLALGLVALGATVAAAADAEITLPNGWHLVAPPDGTVAAVGTLPSGVAVSRDGASLFVLETGHRTPALRVVDARSLRTTKTIKLANAFGAPLRDPDGDGLWIANTITFGDQIGHLDPAAGRFDRTFTLPAKTYPVAIARSPDGTTLAVAGDLSDRIELLDARSGISRGSIRVGRHPAALTFSADGATLFVAPRGERAIDVVDVRGVRLRASVPTGLHPSALARDGNRIYVADADDDDVAVVDAPTLRVVQRVALPWNAPGIVGSSPDALTLDGDRLYVACGAANAVAVYARAGGMLRPLGAIPTGWYPTAVAVAGGALVVADGKGESGHPNPKYRPGASGEDRDYQPDNLLGSLRRIAQPSDVALRDGVATVRRLMEQPAAAPEAVLRPDGPIKHVFYVIRENRTYDQILGDVAAGDGDASLAMYGADVTPNAHALAQRFGLFDRFHEDAHVSADGHNWATAAFANDYLERMWPANYANRRPLYDFEDGADASVPHGGYLWDAAVERKRTLRDYGEFVLNGPSSNGTPVSTSLAPLRGRIDPAFPTFDMDISDQTRFAEWKREFDAFEQSGTLPQLEIVRFPRDHTAGTRVGKNTPRAMIADNDLAVGRLVEAISHSRDWGSSAVFVVEDDAQDGPDHVDEARSVLLVASPYASGGLQHTAVTQASVLRAIEDILGLRRLSPYDAAAHSLGFAFTATPNMQPYDAVPAKIDIDAKNAKTAYGAGTSAAFDLAREDRVDPATMNGVLWHDARGAAATPPPYGAFDR